MLSTQDYADICHQWSQRQIQKGWTPTSAKPYTLWSRKEIRETGNASACECESFEGEEAIVKGADHQLHRWPLNDVIIAVSLKEAVAHVEMGRDKEETLRVMLGYSEEGPSFGGGYGYIYEFMSLPDRSVPK